MPVELAQIVFIDNSKLLISDSSDSYDSYDFGHNSVLQRNGLRSTGLVYLIIYAKRNRLIQVSFR